MPATIAVTPVAAVPFDNPSWFCRTSDVQIVMENSMAVVMTSTPHDHQNKGPNRMPASSGSSRSSVSLPLASGRKNTAATTIASTTETRIPARHPIPIAIAALMTNGAKIPTPEPSPFACVTAAPPFGPWWAVSTAAVRLTTTVPPSPATIAPAIVTATTSHDTKIPMPTHNTSNDSQMLRMRPTCADSRGAIRPAAIAPTARPVPCKPEIARLTPSSSRSRLTDGVNE